MVSHSTYPSNHSTNTAGENYINHLVLPQTMSLLTTQNDAYQNYQVDHNYHD